MRRTISAGVAAVVLVTTLLMASPASATFAGRNGRLVFSRNGNIFTIAPDGTDQVRLTTTGEDYFPAWSPDGRRIAYVRGCEASAIWVMNADGTGATRVSDPGWVQPPLWSPDGTRIAFSDLVDPEHRAIFVVTPDGQRRTRLTTYEHSNSVGGWSPDGATLLFASDRDGDSDVYLMRSDGSGLTKLTQNRVQDSRVSFSPDGSRILFMRTRKGGRFTSIWTMSATGADQRQLTAYRRWDLSPTWSPDGRWIAFRRDTYTATTSSIQLARIAADGSDLRVLTVAPTATMGFAWSPDSTKLVFQDYDLRLDAPRGIGMVGVDGTATTTVVTGNVGVPDWQALP